LKQIQVWRGGKGLLFEINEFKNLSLVPSAVEKS
jgi:hypothetical protein